MIHDSQLTYYNDIQYIFPTPADYFPTAGGLFQLIDISYSYYLLGPPNWPVPGLFLPVVMTSILAMGEFARHCLSQRPLSHYSPLGQRRRLPNRKCHDPRIILTGRYDLDPGDG